VSDELRDQLQKTLGDAYVIERELGGGGMSRVFVARETALDRRVVVKVLPPELSAAVSVERFRREITLSAGLQHPHIVPVLATGVSDGMPYFTMPYVEGESLRARLAREHELTVHDTVNILRDVAKALAYAHARGIVHRDIKPDNVLLSGGSAVVTDFGVAKALSASTEAAGSTLTSLGMAMGTPAYMAPEQAAADPSTDNRADIYALGAMAYEMLTGRPLFPGRSPQQVLAAHTMQAPDPVQQLRPAMPPALAAIVMRCLEKHPADRPQSADELIHALDTLATPSGGSAPAMTAATRALLAPKGGRIHFGRALAAYVIASVVIVAFAALLVQTLGLPDWVLPGAAIVMALGLPMVIVTGIVQHRVAAGKIPAALTGAHRVFTWRQIGRAHV
jgi:eukaryotic-like serine/threonine-protein kinase